MIAISQILGREFAGGHELLIFIFVVEVVQRIIVGLQFRFLFTE